VSSTDDSPGAQNTSTHPSTFVQTHSLHSRSKLIPYPQQIARGLVLPFTVFFSWYLLRTHSSRPTLLAVFLVCLGFSFGVSSENLHASSIGILLGVASSVTTSVHAIVVKRTLPIVQGNTLDLVYYSNLLSAGVIFPFVLLSGEAGTVMELAMGENSSPEALGTFLWGAAITVNTLISSLVDLD
jgi:GDP-fucose transporter C1